MSLHRQYSTADTLHTHQTHFYWNRYTYHNFNWNTIISALWFRIQQTEHRSYRSHSQTASLSNGLWTYPTLKRLEPEAVHSAYYNSKIWSARPHVMPWSDTWAMKDVYFTVAGTEPWVRRPLQVKGTTIREVGELVGKLALTVWTLDITSQSQYFVTVSVPTLVTFLVYLLPAS
jgi:hypothetical protein